MANIVSLNMVNLDDDRIIIKGGGSTGSGGSTGGGDGADVIFYDYDGTILHTYSKDDFLALTEMPELPTQEGLICQEWNWTFDNAIEYVSKYGLLDIGATYITNNGETRLYIEIPSKSLLSVTLQIGSQTISNGVQVDFGDGSPIETHSSTSTARLTHTYANIGKYVIRLTPVEGCEFTLGDYDDGIFGVPNTSSGCYVNMLKKVQLGKNITKIDSATFQGCNCLEFISIPKGVNDMPEKCFYECQALKSVVVPRSISTIKSYFIAYCYTLRSISLPDSITTIGNNFANCCYNLLSVTIPHGVEGALGIKDFYYCYELNRAVVSNGITSIGKNVFYNCYNIEKIFISENVTDIADYAFYGCSIESAAIKRVLHVGQYAFAGCHNLREVEMECVEDISSRAFNECYSLERLVISDVVTSIGENAFSSCPSLKELSLPDSLTSIGGSVFYGCYNLEKINLPQYLVSIPEKLVQGCRSLLSIDIPDGITSIGSYAFQNCKSLTSIIIPNGVTTIPQYAFADCGSLVDVVFPKSVTTIESNAFSGTTTLRVMDFSTHEGVVVLKGSLIFNVSQLSSDLRIIVPDSLYDTWKAATNWSAVSSKIIKKTDWDASQA